MNHRLNRILRPLVHHVTDSRRVRQIHNEVVHRFPKFDEAQLKGKIVVDLGANRGDFSIWAASKGAFVIAMEPDKLAFSYLVNRTSGYPNVFVLNAGAVEKTAILRLYYHVSRSKDPIGHTISSSIDINKGNVSPNHFSEILGINLGAILGELDVFLLKVDVEGAELQLWEEIKTRFSSINYLLMETHSAQTKGNYSDFSTFITENQLQDRWKLDWV